MLRDGRDASLPAEAEYDVVIIGAGPAGITLALALGTTGLRIALLESGGEEFDPDTQALYDGDVYGNEGGIDITASRLRFLGGTSNHWSGHCLPLARVDFERAPPNGMSGWPIPYEEIDAYYPAASEICDLGPMAYDPDEMFDLPPGLLYLQDDPDIATTLYRQSAPTRFGQKYRDDLAAHAGIHLWLWTNATRVVTGSDGQAEAVETETLTGTARRFTAKAVVLANSTIEAARLMLLSNAANGRRDGDQGGLLGRCFMDHPGGNAGMVHFTRPVEEKVYWMGEEFLHAGTPVAFMLAPRAETLRREGLLNSQFFLQPYEGSPEDRARGRAARESVASLKDIAKWAVGYDDKPLFSLSKEYCEFITNADAFAADTMITWKNGARVQQARLLFDAEQAPERTNGVRLSERRDVLGQPMAALDWTPSEDTIASIQRAAVLIGTAFGRSGEARLQVKEEDDDAAPYWGLQSRYHHLGTMRMAAGESDGVVDTDAKVYGTQNVYVAGAAVMPTGGASNPTLSVVALSLRLAEHLKTRLTG